MDPVPDLVIIGSSLLDLIPNPVCTGPYFGTTLFGPVLGSTLFPLELVLQSSDILEGFEFYINMQ